MDIIEKIKEYRMRMGLSEVQVAEAMDISKESYFDIEMHDDELDTLYTFAEVFQMCKILAIPIEELYGESSDQTDNGLNALRDRIKSKMISDRLSEDEVSEIVGWDILPLLRDATGALSYTPNAFRDFCEYTNCSFPSLIKDLHQRWSQQVSS